MTIKILFQKESTEGFEENDTKKVYNNYVKAGGSEEKENNKDPTTGGEKNEKD